MSSLVRVSAVFVLALGCAGGPSDGDDDFLQCEGQCDGAGPLQVSSTWVPVDGFVRAVSASGGISVTPNTGVGLKGSESRRILTFSQPGFYTISASGAGVRVRVSDEGPSIELVDPEPGQLVQIGTGDRISISGRASDPLGEPIELSVGGQSISVAADGSFSAEIPTEFGVNIVKLAATDLADNEFTAPRSFLAANGFSGAPQNAVVSLDNAALKFLASVVTPELPNLVQVPVMDGPVGTDFGHDLFFDGATLPGQDGHPGEMQLRLRAVGDELEVRYLIEGTIVARGHIDGLLDSVATIGIIDPQVTIMLSFDGGLVATVTDIDVVDSGVELDLSGILGIVEDLFISRVRDEVELQLQTIAPSLVAGVLKGLDGQLTVDTSAFNVDTPLAVNYRLGGLFISGDQMNVNLAAQVSGAPLGEIEAPIR